MKTTIPVFVGVLAAALLHGVCAGMGDNMPFVRAFKEDLTPKWEGDQGSVNFLEDSNFDYFHSRGGSNGPSRRYCDTHADMPRVVSLSAAQLARSANQKG